MKKHGKLLILAALVAITFVRTASAEPPTNVEPSAAAGPTCTEKQDACTAALTEAGTACSAQCDANGVCSAAEGTKCLTARVAANVACNKVCGSPNVAPRLWTNVCVGGDETSAQIESRSVKSQAECNAVCARETEGNVAALSDVDERARARTYTCVASALKARVESVVTRNTLVSHRETLDRHDGEIRRAQSTANGASAVANAALNLGGENADAIADLADPIRDLELNAQTGVQLGGVVGAYGMGRGENGAAGGGFIGADLRSKFIPEFGLAASGLVGIADSQTLDSAMVTADIVLLANVYVPDTDLRIGIGPYVKQQWRSDANRADGDMLGNDIGFAAGGQLELAYLFGNMFEVAAFLQLGGGKTGGHDPEPEIAGAKELIVDHDAFQPAGGIKVEFLTPFFDPTDDEKNIAAAD